VAAVLQQATAAATYELHTGLTRSAREAVDCQQEHLGLRDLYQKYSCTRARHVQSCTPNLYASFMLQGWLKGCISAMLPAAACLF
jgi:hypothetical protein